jgi:hypothetical protein
MRAIVRSISMVAAAAGVEDVEVIRKVLDRLGHVPQIVDGTPMWLLDDAEMVEVVEVAATDPEDDEDALADDEDALADDEDDDFEDDDDE